MSDNKDDGLPAVQNEAIVAPLQEVKINNQPAEKASEPVNVKKDEPKPKKDKSKVNSVSL